MFQSFFSKNAVFVVRYVVPAALCITPFLAWNVYGQEGTSEQFPSALEEVKKDGADSTKSQSGFAVLPLPPGPLYAPYAADPRRVDFALQLLHYTKPRIPNAGSNRFDLKTGGEFGLLRIHPRGRHDLGWQLSVEGGFDSQFDIDRHLDNIGWDGKYSLLITTAQTRNLSLKFGWLHDSSHVGDEYAESTGRRRIGYTRQELAGGISWIADSGWRAYAEYGWGKLLGNRDLQKPGRVQAGFEWQPAKFVQGRYCGWYGAADFSAMEERDWRIDVSLQAGYRIDTGGKTWRFGIQGYSGRPPIGEFFQQTETYFGPGLWIDI